MKNKKFAKVDLQEFTLYTLLSDCSWSILDDKELKPHFDAIQSILRKRIRCDFDTNYELADIYVVEEYKKI